MAFEMSRAPYMLCLEELYKHLIATEAPSDDKAMASNLHASIMMSPWCGIRIAIILSNVVCWLGAWQIVPRALSMEPGQELSRPGSGSLLTHSPSGLLCNVCFHSHLACSILHAASSDQICRAPVGACTILIFSTAAQFITVLLLSQAQDRQLAGVKLSKKDVRELRDLMPTDENLLETRMLLLTPYRAFMHVLHLPMDDVLRLHDMLFVLAGCWCQLHWL